jgi:hypothetical protein
MVKSYPSSHGDYIPTRDEDFLAWALALLAYITANSVRLGITDAQIAEHVALVTAFQIALARTKGDERGPVATDIKRQARIAAVHDLRVLVQVLQVNTAVTHSDKIAMQISTRDKSRTPVPAPTGIIELVIVAGAIGWLILMYKDSLTSRRGKPYGVHGAEIRWMISDTPITNPDLLTNSEFSTRTPHKLIFPGADSGKRVYLSMRWENSRGEKGPWCPVQSAIIP